MKPLQIKNKILNVLAKEMKLTSPSDTIHGMHVFQMHLPKNEYDAQNLIKTMHKNECSKCGERVKNGGFKNWENLFYNTLNIRKKYAIPTDPIHKITKEQCNRFLYDLKIRAPFLGYIMEKKALSDLSICLKEQGRHATIREDKYYKIDLIFSCFGIQVKSNTFKTFGQNTEIYAERHREWGLPVFFLYYDSRTQEWINFDEVLEKSKTEINDLLFAIDCDVIN
jgi:hypothetical protein